MRSKQARRSLLVPILPASTAFEMLAGGLLGREEPFKISAMSKTEGSTQPPVAAT